jgi:hypothetical protein
MQVHLVVLGHLVQQEAQVVPAPLEPLGHKVRQDLREIQVSKVQRVTLGLLVILEALDHQGQMGLQVNLVHKVLLEILVLQDPKDLKDHQAFKDHKDHVGAQEIEDHLVLKAIEVFLEVQVHKDPQVTQVNLEVLVQQAQLVRMDHLVLLVHWEK